MPLTDIKIRSAKPREKSYKLSDSGGLYLEVSPSGGKYWRWKYRFAGKEKRLAFGVYPDVSLKMPARSSIAPASALKALNREIILRASDREVNAPEETHLEVVRHVAAVRPTPRRWIDVRAVI